MGEVAESNEIFGAPASPITKWNVLGGLVYLAFVGWLLSHRHPDYFLILYPLLLAWTTVRKSRRPTFVSTAGIVRPLRRPGFVKWDSVDSVARPEPGVYGVRLNLSGGKRPRSIVLEDIQAAESAAAVAAIGGKQLSAPPPRPVRPHSVVRSDVEIEADVRRQAAALAEQRKVMKARSDSLHWRP